jgi:hypothetical protein
MKVSWHFGAFGGEEGEGFAEVVFPHEDLEVGERLLVGLGLPVMPVHEEAGRQAPELAPGIRNPPEVTGGCLMKIDRPDPGDWGFWAAFQSIQYVDPKEEEMLQPDRERQRVWLQDHMDAFGNALHGPDFRDVIKGYRAYIDVGSWIDHRIPSTPR